MKKRILSSLVLWGSLLGTILLLKIHGGLLILTLFSAAAQWELYQMWQKAGKRVAPVAGIIPGTLLLLATHYLHEPLLQVAQTPYLMGLVAALVAIVCASALALVIPTKTRFPGETLLPTSLGILYIPYLLHFLVLIYHLEAGPGGLFLCTWFIITAKFTDMGALLVGKYFGKHKMAPKLSPGKTWEGTFGGALASSGASVATAAIGNQYLAFDFEFPLLAAALIAIPIAFGGQLGDLLESSFKRKAKMKDSGNTIPGIGGTLDLLDSLIPTAPLAYFLLILSLGLKPA